MKFRLSIPLKNAPSLTPKLTSEHVGIQFLKAFGNIRGHCLEVSGEGKVTKLGGGGGAPGKGLGGDKKN